MPETNVKNNTAQSQGGGMSREKQLERKVQILEDRLNQTMGLLQRQQGQQQQEQEDVNKEPEMPDFDDMTNQEVFQWLVGQVKTQVESEIKPVKEEVQKTKQQQKTEEYKRQIQEAEEKYPDFWDYSDEAAKIADRTDGITAEEAYLLAKSKATGGNVEELRTNETDEETTETNETEETTEEEDNVSNEQDEDEDDVLETNDARQRSKNTTKAAQKAADEIKRKASAGEKPTSSSGTQEQDRFTREEAIEAAMDKLGL